MTTTPDAEVEASATVDMGAIRAEAEVAADLRNGYLLYLERARDADKGAVDLDNSAKMNREMAVEFRAKAKVLRDHLTSLGIEVPPEPDADDPRLSERLH